MKQIKIDLILIIIVSVFISACKPLIPTEVTPISTTTSTIEMTPVITTPSPTFPRNESTATPTIYTHRPTLLPYQDALLYKLLHNEECRLPCYLGITPGKTTTEEAELIFYELGAFLAGEYKEGELPVYVYSLAVGDPMFANITPEPMKAVDYSSILHEISITILDKKVQRLHVVVGTGWSGKMVLDYWQQYALGALFSYLGLPDVIRFSSVRAYYSIQIWYDALKIYIALHKKEKDGLICPDMVSDKTELVIKSHSETVGITLPGIDEEYSKSVEDELGITKEEFYNQLLADPSACFAIKETSSP